MRRCNQEIRSDLPTVAWIPVWFNLFYFSPESWKRCLWFVHCSVAFRNGAGGGRATHTMALAGGVLWCRGAGLHELLACVFISGNSTASPVTKTALGKGIIILKHLIPCPSALFQGCQWIPSLFTSLLQFF